MEAGLTWSDEDRAAWAARHTMLGQPSRFFATQEPDPAWRLRFAARAAAPGLAESLAERGMADLADLVRRARVATDGLLSFGGWSVNQPPSDIDMDRIIARGLLIDGAGAKRVRGRPCDCHNNSADHWAKNVDRAAMMTGYALSTDGMWRAHSWVAKLYATGKIHVVETTEPRTAYFGFMRTAEEAMEIKEPRRGGRTEADLVAAMLVRLEAMRGRLAPPPVAEAA